MRIWSELLDGSMGVSAVRCDRCGHAVSIHRSEDDVREMQRFVKIDIKAGAGASYFTAGDTLAADLCERCAHELLASCLRTVSSTSGEIDFPFVNLDELGFDLSDDDSESVRGRH